MKLRLLAALCLAIAAPAATQAQTAAPAKPEASKPAPAKPEAEESKAPAGVNAKLTSKDPDYGYTKAKPVKVGGATDDDGPEAEHAYFRALRDEAGQPVKFSRIGSFGAGPDGNILDGYSVTTSTGRKLVVYIDMYHHKNDPLKQEAPKGLFKAK